MKRDDERLGPLLLCAWLYLTERDANEEEGEEAINARRSCAGAAALYWGGGGGRKLPVNASVFLGNKSVMRLDVVRAAERAIHRRWSLWL